MRGEREIPPRRRFGVGNWYKTPMALMLFCPRCDASTELRGTMDAWYLTWCPECERLWRLEVHSLLEDEPDTAAVSPSARRTRARARPPT
jgi:hypothetical protein